MKIEEYNIYDRQNLTFWVRLTLNAPLSHIKNVVGNTSLFNTQHVLDLEGRRVPCPFFSANAFRGWVLRRIGNMATLDAIASGDWAGELPPDAHHAVFSGGSLGKGASMVNAMGMYDYVARLYPPLRLLGTAKPGGLFGEKGSMMMEGLLNIGNFWLVCYESALYCPPAFLPGEVVEAIANLKESEQHLQELRCLNGSPMQDVLACGTAEQKQQYREAAEAHQRLLRQYCPLIREALKPYGQYLTDHQTTRRDSHHDATLRPYLREGSTGLLEGDTKRKVAKAEPESNQMIVTDQLIATGSQFCSRWDTRTPGITDVEEGFLVFALEEWAKNPMLGGKASRGNGGYPDIEIWYAVNGEPQGRYLELVSGTQRFSDRAQKARDRWAEYCTAYRSYLSENRDAIAGFIGGS